MTPTSSSIPVNTVKNNPTADPDQLTKVADPLVPGLENKSSTPPKDPKIPKKIWSKGKLVHNPAYTAQQGALAREKRHLGLEKAAEVRKRKFALKKEARAKAARGEPLTPYEAACAAWKTGGLKGMSEESRTTFEKEQEILNKTASLIIKPANIHELRLKVEKTANDLGYDPLAELIKMTQTEDLKPEDRISIHKTLLPFLVPTMPPIPKDAMELDGKKVKVVIQQLHFAPEIKQGEDLFKERPKTVDVEVMAPESPLDGHST